MIEPCVAGIEYSSSQLHCRTMTLPSVFCLSVWLPANYLLRSLKEGC